MPDEQLGSGMRLNVIPPSVERRSRQPAPTNTVLGSSTRTCWRSSVMPVEIPDQLTPPSVVFSSVPKLPAAKPVPPAKSIAFS